MRLTRKNNAGNYVFNFGIKQSNKLLNRKLGQLEDIEEELGIDLITLFKALKNGFYAKVKLYETVRLHEHIYNGDELANCFEFKRKEIGEKVVFLKKPKLGHDLTYMYGYSKDYTQSNGKTCELIICELKDCGKTWALTKEELL